MPRKREIQKEKNKPPPVARLIGFHVEKALRGRAVLSMRVRKEHEHSNGTVHGGILCSLSDSAMGFAFMSILSPHETGVTVEFKISFFEAVWVKDHLLAAARILAHGKSLYFLECEIHNSQGRLVAKAASTCKVVSSRKSRNES